MSFPGGGGPARATAPLRAASGSAAQQAAAADRLGSSSASSSVVMSQQSRQDHVVHRSYLKFVAVLVEGRLTHYAAATKGGKRKEDKWFNLCLPEVDLHRSDLKVYHSVSTYPPTPTGQLSDPTANTCSVPPLLVAFILDTSDLPSGQALLWNKDGQKVAVDVGSSAPVKGKGKEREGRTGIVLERWTLRATYPASNEPSTSTMPPHTAYRFGISHFRSLYALIRLLPTYKLYRKLRRANNGLRMGIKLWTAEDYPNSPGGIDSAWTVMEQGLVGLDVGLDRLVPGHNNLEAEDIQRYELPSLDIFGTRYTASVDYRLEVDFHVEDMETVLSEKFVDMEEDWFTPTVARHRMEAEEGAAAASQTGRPGSIGNNVSRTERHMRRLSNPGMSTTTGASPIPQRQQAATRESFKTSPLADRSVSSGGVPGFATGQGGSAGRSESKYGGIGEGLPFAVPPSGSQETSKPATPIPSSQSGSSVAARRLSGHSVHPFSASPTNSTSVVRQNSPLGPAATASSPHGRPSLSGASGGERVPSSLGRTSSFLSQSGRSFTHAQVAHMMGTSASPPVLGAMSGLHGQSPPATQGQVPVSPSSLSYSRQSLSRQVSRPSYLSHGASGSSPFVPSSLERDANIFASSPSQPPQIIQRYSSSYSRQSYLGGGPSSSGSGGVPGSVPIGSHGSSGDNASLPGSIGRSLLRRTSTSASHHSTLRHSVERAPPGPDDDEIQAFLKTLETLPQPPSVAAQTAQAARSRLPSSSSSLSVNSLPHSPSPLQRSGSPPLAHAPGTAIGTPARAPITRAQLEADLQQMAGSFNLAAGQMATLSQSSTPGMLPSSRGSLSASPRLGAMSAASGSAPVTVPSGVGLLSASRPVHAAARRISGTSSPAMPVSHPPYRRQTSGGIRSSSVKTGSPLAGEPISPPRLDNEGDRAPMPPRQTLTAHAGARSLPGAGSAPLAEDQAMPLRSAGMGAVALGIGGLAIGSQTPQFGILSPQTTGGQSASTNDSTRTTTSTSRRGPVLLRGGFGDNPRGGAGPAGTGYAGSSPFSKPGSASASPSHSPIRDFAARANKERIGHGERQAEEELGSWRRYKSFGSVGLPPSASGAPLATMRGHGTAAAGDNAEEGGSRRTSGRTAPSSLGASGLADDGEPQDDTDVRGRRRRMASDGDEAR